MPDYIGNSIDADIESKGQLPTDGQPYGGGHEPEKPHPECMPVVIQYAEGSRQDQADHIFADFFERCQAGSFDIANRKYTPVEDGPEKDCRYTGIEGNRSIIPECSCQEERKNEKGNPLHITCGDP